MEYYEKHRIEKWRVRKHLNYKKDSFIRAIKVLMTDPTCPFGVSDFLDRTKQHFKKDVANYLFDNL